MEKNITMSSVNEQILIDAILLVLNNIELKKCAKTCILALDDVELAIHLEMALDKAKCP